jgi:hypothetical protein
MNENKPETAETQVTDQMDLKGGRGELRMKTKGGGIHLCTFLFPVPYWNLVASVSF